MNFELWLRSHRRSVLFLFVLLTLGGIFGGMQLPVALFPQADFPRVVVDIDAGERPAAQMALQVTAPVEEMLHTVPGLRTVRSASSRGNARISLNFEWGHDMTAATLQIETTMSQVLPSLPAGTTYQVERMSPTVFPCMAYSLVSDTVSPVALRDLAVRQIRPVFSAVKGVARFDVQGGDQEEIHVSPDPARLAAAGLTLDDLSTALSGANVVSAAGRLEDQGKLFLVLTDARLGDLNSVRQVIVHAGPGGVLRLGEVAEVTRAAVPQQTRVTADGHVAVLIQVYQQPDANTVQIARDLRAALDALKPQLPADVQIANWYDQSQLILASADSVRDAVIIGVILAGGVLLLFLRNTRVTLVAILCVPATLAATLLLLDVLHMSLNIMTLGGMAAAVGLIIDDAIVMVEHIVRRLRDPLTPGSASGSSILGAASEFTRPLAGSSACTLIVFAPLTFLSGVTGAFFKALSLTMASSLLISFLVAWLVVPLLSEWLLAGRDNHVADGAWTLRAHSFYRKWLGALLRRPWLALLWVVPFLALGYISYTRVGSGFMPAMDEGGFVLDYVATPGTALAETDRILRGIEKILKETPEVETYSRRTGLGFGGGLVEANEGDFFVRLHGGKRREAEEVMDDIRAKINKTAPALDIAMFQLMEDMIGDLTAVPEPIEIKLYCDNDRILTQLGPKIAAAIGEIPGVVDTKNGLTLAGDALNLHVDRDKAALEGLDVESVSKQLTGAMDGTIATEVQRGPKMIGIRVGLPARDRSSLDRLKALPLRATDGHILPLSRVATLEIESGQPQITRDNLKLMVPVTGRISGRDLGSTIRDIQALLKRPGLLPIGVTYELGGTYAEQQKAFAGLIAVFGAATALVFLLLLFLQESFRAAAAMLLSTLLTLPAVFIGLWLTKTELNISSMMGLTMIIGISAEVAIFLVSELDEMPPNMPMIDAFIQAGLNRMRPIAMTTLAAILALSPLALGLGQGSAMQQPLAIAIIAGLLAQFPMVLLILPVILRVFAGKSRSRDKASATDGI